eukprot:15448356-Alexandrium_andersonii.AAC.1
MEPCPPSPEPSNSLAFTQSSEASHREGEPKAPSELESTLPAWACDQSSNPGRDLGGTFIQKVRAPELE